MTISTSAEHSPEKVAPPDHREIEWQFDVEDARAVERWLDEGARRGGLSVSTGEVKRLNDSYLDTEDWRLYRAGFALRVRRRGKRAETTMKSLASASKTPGLRERIEISEPLKSPRPAGVLKAPGPVGERVRALVGSRSLDVIFEIRTRRVAYDLFVEDEHVAEVSLDETEIPTPEDSKSLRLRRVEIEARPEDLSRLKPFIEELRSSFDLSPGASSKYRSGLAARGLEPPGPPEFGPTDVDASLTLGEVAFAVMREQFARFLAHESGTRLGEDPEELHDMRVASRRLRAAMQLFADALPVRSRRLRDEVKHFAGVLGDVRDLDVQLDRLGAWAEVAPEDREPLGKLAEVLEKRRAKTRERMLRALDSDGYERFVATLTALLERGPSHRTEAAGRPVLAAAPDIVRRR